MDKKEIEKKARKIIDKITKEEYCGDGKIYRVGRRYIFLSTDYFPYDFTRDLEELFGVAGDAILYKGGYKVGGDLVKYYRNIAEEKNLDIYDIMSSVGWYFGWCIGILIEKGEKYKVIVYDSFEAESYLKREGKTEKPVCHFLRGVLAGIISEVNGEKYKAVEKKCKAMGDEYCEFEVERVIE